jgi:hypothetical protein
MKNHNFYMSSYLIDIVCATNSFPAFNWAWTQKKGLIHLYCSQLWEANCKKYFYDICDYFLAPLHKAIFGLFPHKISPGALKGLKEIRDWYMKKYYTYIWIYRATGVPHFFPSMFLISYYPGRLHTRLWKRGATTYLSEKNKRYWPIFPSRLGHTL